MTPNVRSVLAPIAALVLCLAALAAADRSSSPDRSSLSERSGVLAAVATLNDGAACGATDAEPMQASCGDGRCSAPEDCNSCPGDCGSCCGDGRCSPPEDARSCPRDCN